MRLFFVYGLTSRQMYELMEFLDNPESGFVRKGGSEWRVLTVEDIRVVLDQKQHTWEVCLIQTDMPNDCLKEAAPRVTYILEGILHGCECEIYDSRDAASAILSAWGNPPAAWIPRSSHTGQAAR